MRTETHNLTIRRILVPLASPRQSLAALDMAARLAADFEAELVGVYLREPEFLTAASLPGSRFSYSSRTERQVLDVANMERALRVRAAQLRSALESTARRMHLRWSFQDITGTIDEMIEKAVHDFDLVALNYLGGVSSAKNVRDITSEKIPQRMTSSYFMIRRESMKDAPVVVLLDGGIAALEPAAKIARFFGRELNIMITTPARGGEGKLTAELRGWLGGHHLPVRIVTPQKANIESILAAIEDVQPGLLVMGRAHPLRQDARFGALMSRLDCPLFLVAG
jgi:hypothetical protein